MLRPTEAALRASLCVAIEAAITIGLAAVVYVAEGQEVGISLLAATAAVPLRLINLQLPVEWLAMWVAMALTGERHWSLRGAASVAAALCGLLASTLMSGQFRFAITETFAFSPETLVVGYGLLVCVAAFAAGVLAGRWGALSSAKQA